MTVMRTYLICALALSTAGALQSGPPLGEHRTARRRGLDLDDTIGSWQQGLAEHQAVVHTLGSVDMNNKAKRSTAGMKGVTLCAGQKWLPELYLLGVPKSATTEMAVELANNGIPSVANVTGVKFWAPSSADDPDDAYIIDKESYYFAAWVIAHHGKWNVQQANEDWHAYLPACPAKDDVTGMTDRLLYADYSPSHLSMVAPLNASLTVSGQTPYGVFNFSDVNLPSTLQAFYGALSSRLTFIVMLREPVSMLQSLWYFAVVNVQKYGPEGALFLGALPSKSTFLAELEDSLQRAQIGTLSMWLWQIYYGQQVEAFLQGFAASQFMFIPMYYYLHLARPQVCIALQQFLQHPISCLDVAPEINSEPHPSVEEDLPVGSTLRTRIDDLMTPENDRLVQVLHQAHLQGTHLPAFARKSGEPVNDSDVREWLYAGW